MYSLCYFYFHLYFFFRFASTIASSFLNNKKRAAKHTKMIFIIWRPRHGQRHQHRSTEEKRREMWGSPFQGDSKNLKYLFRWLGRLVAVLRFISSLFFYLKQFIILLEVVIKWFFGIFHVAAFKHSVYIVVMMKIDDLAQKSPLQRSAHCYGSEKCFTLSRLIIVINFSSSFSSSTILTSRLLLPISSSAE